LRSYNLESLGISIKAYEHSQFGEPILFLHYMGGNSDIWETILPFFIAKYRVITIDLPGHGKSGFPELEFDIDLIAKSISDLLDSLRIDKAHIVGSSLGAYIGTRFASLYQSRVSSLINSEGAIQNVSGQNGRFNESKEEFLNKYFNQTDKYFSSFDEYYQYMKSIFIPWNDVRKKIVENAPLRHFDDGRIGLIPTKNVLRQIASSLYDIRLEEWYKQITCPILFLPAEQESDLPDKLDSIEKIKQIVKYAETEVIKDSTHAMMIDHPKEMSEAILKFIVSKT
jgi:pimeloyl-ACP methyl ester carboxylesterase